MSTQQSSRATGKPREARFIEGESIAKEKFSGSIPLLVKILEQILDGSNTFLAGSYVLSLLTKFSFAPNDIDIYITSDLNNFNEEIKRIKDHIAEILSETGTPTSAKDFETSKSSEMNILSFGYDNNSVLSVRTLRIRGLSVPLQFICLNASLCETKNLSSYISLFRSISDKIGSTVVQLMRKKNTGEFHQYINKLDCISELNLEKKIIPRSFFANDVRASKYANHGFTISD